MFTEWHSCPNAKLPYQWLTEWHSGRTGPPKHYQMLNQEMPQSTYAMYKAAFLEQKSASIMLIMTTNCEANLLDMVQWHPTHAWCTWCFLPPVNGRQRIPSQLTAMMMSGATANIIAQSQDDFLLQWADRAGWQTDYHWHCAAPLAALNGKVWEWAVPVKELTKRARRWDLLPGHKNPCNCMDLQNLGKSKSDQKLGKIQCVCLWLIRWDNVYLPRGLPNIYSLLLSPSLLPLILHILLSLSTSPLSLYLCTLAIIQPITIINVSPYALHQHLSAKLSGSQGGE